MREELEFFPVDEVPWEEDSGIEQRVLSRADDGVTLTRLARWPAGHDTSASGTIRHQYHEEIYLLEGELTDLTLQRTFGPGHYASPTGYAARAVPHRDRLPDAGDPYHRRVVIMPAPESG